LKNILVLGAAGQIGSELTPALRKVYGDGHVVAADIRGGPRPEVREVGSFEIIDCMDAGQVAQTVRRYKIDTIYNLVALLSATGEANPQLAWKVNVGCLLNVLDVAREHSCAVFTPSSIGAFGPETPRRGTPQDTVMRPRTMYGITKVTGELLSDYYFLKYGVDARGLRYPGLISNVALPGGGTTDYAVHIYYDALRRKAYTCPLKAGTCLDMMYMPDAVAAAMELMEADPGRLRHRNCFNVAAMSFDPEGIAAEIRKHLPEFRLTYDVNPTLQRIADSWPESMDDSSAREEWGWKPKYDLANMTADMLTVLRGKMDRG
jgi:nucleoside-diphosphate-sugar epimerase